MLVVSTHSTPFENPLIDYHDDRGVIKRIKDLSSATVKEWNSRWQRRYNPMKKEACHLFPTLDISNTYHIDELQWQQSTKLVVLIHGLNSSPLAWTNYIEEITQSKHNVSYFAPFVYKKGYCKCKEAALPILNVVQNYAHRYPKNPIVLVGHSNGARIAAEIEQKLKTSNNVHLISIAGPHCGSKLINWTNTLGLTRCLGFSVTMVKELTYKGSWARKKLTKWIQQQQDECANNVERTFFASLDDWRIFPNKTSFPNLPNSSYYVLTRESHVTIIDAVRKKVLSYI